MRLLTSQFLQVRSSKRSAGESICNFSVSVPHDELKCKQEQMFKVSVQSFDLYHTWTYINSSNNIIVLFNILTSQTTTINVPYGNYTGKALAYQLTQLYANWVVEWNAAQNKYLFTFTTPHILFNDLETTPGQACVPLGFNRESYFTDASFQVTSVKVLRPTLSERINVHIDNLAPYDKANLTNADGIAKSSNSILSIVNNFSPFDIIKYESNTDLYGFVCAEKSIEKLVISLRDIDGSLLTFIDTDFNLVLRFDTYEQDDTRPQDEMLTTLKQVAEYLRLIFVSTNMKQ